MYLANALLAATIGQNTRKQKDPSSATTRHAGQTKEHITVNSVSQLSLVYLKLALDTAVCIKTPISNKNKTLM
jgi:hypothetical protein